MASGESEWWVENMVCKACGYHCVSVQPDFFPAVAAAECPQCGKMAMVAGEGEGEEGMVTGMRMED